MMQKKLQVVARFLYNLLGKSRLNYVFFPKDVQYDIQILGKEKESYYVQKLTYVCGLVLVAILLVAVYLVQSGINKMSYVEVIDRPQADEETTEILVQAGNQGDIYHLEVTPVLLTKEEADSLILEAVNKLEHYICGNNRSLDSVTENLVLHEYISGYPFQIYWESDREQIIDTTGNVNREGLEEDTVVVLTAVFYYGDWHWEQQFGALVCKEVLTEAERYERQLQKLLIESEKNQRSNRFWEMPEAFEGEKLTYRLIEEDYTILILAGLILLVSMAVWIGQDNDLRVSRTKRRTIFQEEYITLVSSLSMYISAGLNLQMAMKLCCHDYTNRKPKEHLLRCALQDFQRDIQNGYSFSEAMNRFSNSTDEVNYKRLAGILNEGLIHGAHGLSEVLEKEVEKIRDEKRRHSKVKGEQISTALIAPMMLQLGIVIALILIPAFTSMQF